MPEDRRKRPWWALSLPEQGAHKDLHHHPVFKQNHGRMVGPPPPRVPHPPRPGAMPETTVTTGRVLLLKPGDTLLIAGTGPTASAEEADQLHDLLAQLKTTLNLAAVWAFEADIDIAKAEIATRLKAEEEQ